MREFHGHGAQNLSAFFLLDKDHNVEIVRIPVGIEFYALITCEGRRRVIWIRNTDFAQRSQRGDVAQDVSGILSSIHRRLQTILGDCQPDLRGIARCVSSQFSYFHGELLRAFRVRFVSRDREIRLHALRRFPNCNCGVLFAAAHKLRPPVHDHLWRINLVGLEKFLVSDLPLRPLQ